MSAKEAALVEAPSAPIAKPQEQGVSIFERLARDASMDVDKLDRLMQMYERTKAKEAEQHFHAELSAAQKDMRPIAADATNPQTKSKYATYAALDTALRPIYTEHGFGLSFDTGDCPTPNWVRVLCHVSHLGGHSKTYHLDMPADGKGAKGGDVMTLTHATGAAVSYGMRYLLKMIFNVAVGEADTDGNSNGGHVKPTPKAPEGFEQWLMDLQATADTGFAALQAAWKASKPEYREHLKAVDQGEVERLKAKAQKVKVSA